MVMLSVGVSLRASSGSGVEEKSRRQPPIPGRALAGIPSTVACCASSRSTGVAPGGRGTAVTGTSSSGFSRST